jgi:hypothetical protein
LPEIAFSASEAVSLEKPAGGTGRSDALSALTSAEKMTCTCRACRSRTARHGSRRAAAARGGNHPWCCRCPRWWSPSSDSRCEGASSKSSLRTLLPHRWLDRTWRRGPHMHRSHLHRRRKVQEISFFKINVEVSCIIISRQKGMQAACILFNENCARGVHNYFLRN